MKQKQKVFKGKKLVSQLRIYQATPPVFVPERQPSMIPSCLVDLTNQNLDLSNCGQYLIIAGQNVLRTVIWKRGETGEWKRGRSSFAREKAERTRQGEKEEVETFDKKHEPPTDRHQAQRTTTTLTSEAAATAGHRAIKRSERERWKIQEIQAKKVRLPKLTFPNQSFVDFLSSFCDRSSQTCTTTTGFTTFWV
jgi:hypothetical protein